MAKPREDALSLIDPIVAPPNSEALQLYQQELESYSVVDEGDEVAYEQKIKRAFHARELKQIDEIIESRKAYANKIFLLVVCWLVSMGAIILLTGFKPAGFDLDQKVLLALIGGTTLNVLGIFTIVANFLFPKNGHSILSRSNNVGADTKVTTSKGRSPRSPKGDSKSSDASVD